ncbi:DUF2236 domain-containing protein [Rhodococcus sp. D2-41]|uniref:DUF2236 domain-containing protein n=1 Tax=Speluncibacter jeojiensis TaxID=2710754 RepID=A0A9X4M3N1_9ACTN|nr:oxygenase MpaB family protein [Rhodococcus sp. D2-41]MDG3009055.1 DUF2236 domain-containing protein [Rhodococcus sp. D2-41]MDG3015567.1 DUF2236 domain-containing protein [Corynebacteriales bacterium D3-21]
MPGPFLQVVSEAPESAGPAAPRGRHGWVRLIETLDPAADAQTIHRITVGYEFPWDYERALEISLMRTYCVPSISAVLRRSGEFEHRPQKRYDDTALLMAELLEHGYDSARGHEALRAINRMHSRYTISNDDMLYVLSTFIYDPLDWIDRFGWRRLHPKERLAAFHYYRGVGSRMGIRDIPESFQELQRFKSEYEQRHFRYSDDNNRIGTYTRELFCSWFPTALRPLAARGVYAMLDEEMSEAFGFPTGSATLRAAAEMALRTRGRVERWWPVRRSSRLTHDPHNHTYPGYPDGYRPGDLGSCPRHLHRAGA